jgi:hypothetical protein
MAKSKPIRKCLLCLQTKELQDSHLMPRALYEKTRWEGMPNPNPGLLTPQGLIQAPRQVTDHVLCFECEQQFNHKGEKYAMSHVCHRGSFPLLKILLTSKPTKSDIVFTWFDQGSTPTIDRDALGYFALSVFWRAAVHEWTIDKGVTHQIHLGAYQETIRTYLYGQTPFPSNVILMTIVCTDAASQNTFFAPTMSGKKGGLTTYMFQARGLSFMMTSGEAMMLGMKSLPD